MNPQHGDTEDAGLLPAVKGENWAREDPREEE